MSDEQPLAFPGMEYDDTAGQRYHYGMELRDWFAGQALVGILAHHNGPAGDWAKCSTHAYEVADAMMEARKHD